MVPANQKIRKVWAHLFLTYIWNTEKRSLSMKFGTFFNKYPFVFFFSIFGGIIALTVYAYNVSEQNHTKISKIKTLNTILDFKCREISEWYLDEVQDANLISKDPTLIELIQRMHSKKDFSAEKVTIHYLNQIQEEHVYANIVLFYPDGHLMTSADQSLLKSDSLSSQMLANVFSFEKNSHVDFFWSSVYHKDFMDFLFPLYNHRKVLMGGILFRKDLDIFLNPMLNFWPSEEHLVETCILKKTSDKSVLRYAFGPSAKDSSCWIPLQFSIDIEHFIGLHDEGFLDVRDESNRAVFLCFRPLKGTPWSLMVKADKKELFSDEVSKIWASLILGVMLLVTCILFVSYLNRYRKERATQKLLEKELELRQYQEYFKLTMDVLGEGIITVDSNGCIRYLNQQAEKWIIPVSTNVLGASLEKILKVTDDDGNPISFDLEQMIQNKESQKCFRRCLLLMPDRSIPIELLLTSYINDNVGFSGVIVSIHDETENRRQEKLIQESENRFRSLFQNAPDVFILADANGMIQMANEHASEIFEYSNDELIGLSIWALLPPRFLFQKYYWSEIIDGKKAVSIGFNVKLYGQRKSGKEFPIQAALNPIYWKNMDPSVMMIIRDNTEKQRNEEFVRFSGAIIGKMEDGYCVFSEKEGTILQTNAKLDCLYGYEQDELIGKSISMFWPFDEQENREKTKMVLKRLANEKRLEQEVQCLRKDGTLFWIKLIIYSFTHDEWGPLWISIHQDITLRKKAEIELENSAASYKNLFENNPLPMWVYDLETFEFLAVNNAAVRKYGYTQDEFLKMTVLQLIPKEDSQAFLEMAEPGSAFMLETTLRHQLKNGRIIVCERASHNLIYQYRKARLVLANDVTKNREYEAQLVEARDKAEEGERLKSAFLANMSHEIRTPLNSIIGFSGIISESDIQETEMKRYAQYIEESGTRLLELLDNIVRVSKIESGVEEVILLRFFLNSFLRSVFAQFHLQAKSIGLDYSLVFPDEMEHFELVSDNLKLGQILTNFLSNAIKFTPQGSIEMGYILLDRYIDFYVKDTGRGIPPELLDRIFERFFQADQSMSRGYEGAGLGLAVCKGFADLLGATIQVESVYQEGSTFHLLLPR
jgi:PAS domain S-box-containing protein